MSAPPSGTVTFLFTDIEGSTRRWDEAPDAMEHALARHDALLREAVERHGGHIFKTMGDAFYAGFARATDAVTAAVAAQRALAAESWGEGSPGRVRMALHTGTADEREGDYFGPPLNRVARVLEAGHGGQVLLTTATVELVRDRLPEGVQLRDLGEHRLRDLTRPEHVFQLAIWRLLADFPALRTVRDLRTTPPTPATSFVGRSAELARLRTALDAAIAGQGRLVLVSGEPGIGKTRLAQELSAEAQGRGCPVLWGRCWEGEGAPAFWPWVEALGAYARSLDPQTLRSRLGDAAPDLAHLVPHIKSALPDLPAPPPAEPEQARFRLFSGVTDFLTTVASVRPLVLVLDDLHWADKSSLLLLQFLVRQLGTARVLVLGTYRDTDLDRTHPLAEALGTLRREPVCERVGLRGLSLAEVVALMEARAGHALDTPGRALAEALHRETEGNPLFVQETLRHLVETGGIAQEDGHWRVTTASVADLGIPEGVREVIGRRLSHLSEACNQVLAVAAVLGRDFDADVLERVSGQPGDAVDGALGEASSAAVVAEPARASEPYRFTHALVRETVLRELPIRRRVRLHRQVAEALEAHYGGRAERHAAELAHHFAEAAVNSEADTTKAVRYGRLAGEQAEAQTAWEEAARHYERCLTLLAEAEADGGTAEDEAALLLALGRCQHHAAEYRAAWGSLMRAVTRYRERGDAVGMARATVEAVAIVAPPARRFALVEEALAALAARDERDPYLTARLLLGRTTESWDDAAERAAARALDLAERHGYDDVRAALMQRQASRARYEGGNYEEARALFRAAHETFVRAGRVVEAARPLLWGAQIPLALGRLDEGVAAVEESRDYIRRVHARQYENDALATLAAVALARCQFDRFAALAGDVQGDYFTIDVLHASRAEWAGELERALSLLPSPERAGGAPVFTVMLHGPQARIRHRAGDIDGARRALAAWAAAQEAVPRIAPWSLASVDECLPELGDDALVRAVADQLGRAAARVRFAVLAPLGLDQMRGALALRLDRIDEAERHYRTGLEWAEREHCPVEQGRCLEGLAEVALRRGQTAEAHESFERAAALFEAHGAAFYLRRLAARRAAAGS